MGDLDQGASAIGELRAEMRESRRQRQALFEKVDDLSGQVAALSGQVAQLGRHLLPLADLAAEVPQLEAAVREMRPAVQQCQEERIGRRYLVWFVGTACAGLGAVAPVATEAVKAFLKSTPNP